jgi:growth hormone-inducible transmembrane protein
MLRPLITKVGSKPFQGFFISSFHRSKPFTLSLFVAPVAKRFATHQAATRIAARPSQATNCLKIIGQLGIVGGTVVGLNLFFNHETREDGIPAVERAYLHETFKYVGAGLGITALAARGLHIGGWSAKLMALNPSLVLVCGLALSIGIHVH